jgi:hypothetical protein
VLEVRADEQAQVFVVSGSDGKTTAARVENDVSTLLSAEDAQAFLAAAPPAPAADGDKVTFRVPGLSIEAAGNGEDGGGAGSVKVNIDGKTIDIAGEGSGEDGDATVRIAGVDADAARDFIEKSDGVSEEVKAQMRASLGL